MPEYTKLKTLLKNKSILYIPIYSCFNYQTNQLNFKSDGNINRFLSTFYHCNTYKKLDILCPPIGNNKDWFDKVCNDFLKNCNLISCNLIQKSAKIERSIEFSYQLLDFFEINNINIKSYDYIICEAQHVFLRLYNIYGPDKLIYWCPVCATDNKTRDFLEPYKEIDKFIFSIANNVIVASKDQVEYYNKYQFKGNLIQIESLIDRSLPIFNYIIDEEIISTIKSYNVDYNIFLPFRLTDKGYQTKQIIDYLFKYSKINNHKNFKVFYSNPNNCDIYSFSDNLEQKMWIDNNFIKVSKDRNTYYTIIDHCNVIIPYFEDIDFIVHAAINEFDLNKCKLIRNIEDFKKYLNKK